ncbi:hypothetical protein S40293_08146 [Stachybotrys chartarum IBT 40293]|nr:hypothetical protein S40293_08146 [Stachybotrys chartarum IBT 40293]
MWSDQDFQTSKPVGRPYPYNITCPPVNYAANEQPGTCILGSLPVFAINATTREDVAATLAFAKRSNIRLVVTGTRHDLLDRSDDYGGFEVWLRYFRNAITFQTTYTSAARECSEFGWTGSAIHENNVIVVGGGSISVVAIGGWSSGGGHGPASRNYGLGADQIFEAEVLLANGTVVIANHFQNTDLLRSIRGGGPGYGIVLSSIVKAHPNVDTLAFHSLAIAPFFQTPEDAELLDAVTVMLQAYSDLNDAGFAGYAYWFRNFPGPFIGNISSGYFRGLWAIGKTQEEANTRFAPVCTALEPFRDRLLFHETFRSYTDYWSFYEAESGVYDPTGDTSILTSRLLDRPALADGQRVREAMEIVSGNANEFASNVVLLVGGGQVFKDTADLTSGQHPAWRTSSFALVTGCGIPRTARNEVRRNLNDDITFVKGAATKALAPDTGGYMNEGDRHDPDYKDTFYGSNYAAHLAAKLKYDPEHVFYCPTCVGSEFWIELPDEPLCRA